MQDAKPGFAELLGWQDEYKVYLAKRKAKARRE
jgi:hypothetical protein